MTKLKMFASKVDSITIPNKYFSLTTSHVYQVHFL